MARTDLNKIARRIIDRGLRYRWEPTTLEIAEYYQLSDKQVETVKRRAKKYAEEKGVLWAYDPHPKVRRFRICPDNDKGSARRMLEYAYKSWAAMGESVSAQVRGAEAQEYLTASTAKALVSTNKKFSQGIAALYSDRLVS